MRVRGKKAALAGQRFGRWHVVERDRSASSRWWCVCDCGTRRSVKTANLTSGQSNSCGCLHLEKIRTARKERGHAGFVLLFLQYQKGAAAREKEWRLSEVQFRALTEGACHYCGMPPSQVRTPNNRLDQNREWSSYTYSGLDRVDNSLGYVPGNCVPCCETCNRAKLEMSVCAFYAWLQRVGAHRPWEKLLEHNGSLSDGAEAALSTEGSAA